MLKMHVLKIWKHNASLLHDDLNSRVIITTIFQRKLRKSDQIILLPDSSISTALNFVFYLFCDNLKGKYHISRKIRNKKSISMRHQYSFLFLHCRNLGLIGPVQLCICLHRKEKSYKCSWASKCITIIYLCDIRCIEPNHLSTLHHTPER